MRPAIAAFVSGVLFAVGLAISGMARPEKVIGFLDVAGGWDPSLALVMGGGMAVYLVAVRLAARRGPLPHAERADVIDARLVGGSAIFGVGWGISGYCPGPALLSAAAGLLPALVFTGAMLAGFLVRDLTARPAGLPIAPRADTRT